MTPAALDDNGMLRWTFEAHIYALCVSPEHEREAWEPATLRSKLIEWFTWSRGFGTGTLPQAA